jgi:hypothetical protein
MLSKGVQKSETGILHWRCVCGMDLILSSHGGWLRILRVEGGE